MPTINPHINFNGNAAEAFEFYRSVFGGSFSKVIRFKDVSGPEMPIPPEEADKLMHIALPIGKNLLIGNDVPSFMGTVNENENRSKISVSPDTREQAEKIFKGLSAGGEVEVSSDENDTYFAMFRDKFGIEWIVDFNAGY